MTREVYANSSRARCAIYMWARSFFPRADCNFLAPRKEYYRHAKRAGKELPSRKELPFVEKSETSYKPCKAVVYPAGITIGISRWYPILRTRVLECTSRSTAVQSAVVPSSNNTSFGVLMPRFFKKFVCTVLWTRGQGTRTFSGNFPGHVDRGPARSGYARLIGSS